MNEHNKCPSSTDNNPDIKQLGRWVKYQITSYPNQTSVVMQDPDIRQEWEEISSLMQKKDWVGKGRGKRKGREKEKDKKRRRS
jgi:hypothetical protein